MASGDTPSSFSSLFLFIINTVFRGFPEYQVAKLAQFRNSGGKPAFNLA